MGNEQRQITGHVEIAGLGCSGKRLTGKNVTVFTIDGNAITGEVLEANYTAVYIAESADRTRMIKASAVSSISMSKEDAEKLRAEEVMTFASPVVVSRR